MTGRIQDRVVLISGGARGLGASHARLLVAEGANVVIGELHPPRRHRRRGLRVSAGLRAPTSLSGIPTDGGPHA